MMFTCSSNQLWLCQRVYDNLISSDRVLRIIHYQGPIDTGQRETQYYSLARSFLFRNIVGVVEL